MKKLIKEYFTFSQKETIVAIIILVVTGIFVALPFYYSNLKAKEPLDSSFAIEANALIKSYDSINKSDNPENSYSKKYSNNYSSNTSYKLIPFKFDPNKLDENGWHKLGLPEKVVKTILNYRSKGGYFKSAEDIRKIWGLKKEDADILMPYITVEARQNNYQTKNYTSYNKTKLIGKIDINSASVNEFKQLPGLGNLAYKVFNFREKLGGFISIDQIQETYGITDSIYQVVAPFLTFRTTEIRKLNINTSTDFELSKHPYISYDVAKAIVIYRNKKGNYNDINEIKKIVFITDLVFQKMAPYLTID